MRIPLQNPSTPARRRNHPENARPLARVIQEQIKKPLADEILFGRLVRGGHVVVGLKDGKIAFEIEEEKPSNRDNASDEAASDEPALA